MKRPSEKDVAAPVVAWLQLHGWEVHQEVQVSTYGKRADIVGVLGTLLWVIEVKSSMSLALLEQTAAWDGWGNFLSAAAHRANPGAFVIASMERLGIGLFTVSGSSVSEKLEAKLFRRRCGHLESALCDETKTWAKAGGTCTDEWFTPFRRTNRRVCEIVTERPGIATKELMSLLDHHYSSSQSARCALIKWARTGHLKGVRIDRPPGSKSILWFPALEAKEQEA